jgi:hypothetical protein
MWVVVDMEFPSMPALGRRESRLAFIRNMTPNAGVGTPPPACRLFTTGSTL